VVGLLLGAWLVGVDSGSRRVLQQHGVEQQM